MAHFRSDVPTHSGRNQAVARGGLTGRINRAIFHSMKILDVPQSGSQAGTTSSRNRYGQYRRTRATPVNPRSSAQGLVRARMAASAANWRGITALQRAGWADLGAMMSRTDSLGQTYTLSGFQAFCSVNNNLAMVGDAAITDATALVTPATLRTAVITLTAAAFSIAFTPTPPPAGVHVVAYCSPQRSAGRAFESDLRFILSSAAAAASPLVLTTAYTAKFGTPVTGNRVFVSLVTVKGGFESGPLLTSAVVA